MYMTRKYNFYSGPATLAPEVLQEVEEDLRDYRGMGLSLVETSHRSDEYMEVHQEAISALRSLLKLPQNYNVLLMGGGATLQFSMVPLNLMTESKTADFVNSGSWAQKAIADARRYGKARVIWEYAEHNSLPDPGDLSPGADSDYLHITSNETINGIQWKDFPETHAPLVADMSSDILSRPMPVERFGLIYASAQKNLGTSGVTVVIIREDLLNRCPDSVGVYLNYRTHAKAESLYNTPPVFSVWVLSKVLNWIRDRGGPAGMELVNQKKAALLYGAIDNTEGFYRCPVEPRFRSTMNVVFTLRNSELKGAFIEGAAERNMIGLKGHRSVGGIRASIYNAMPMEGVQALADYMVEFATRRG